MTTQEKLKKIKQGFFLSMNGVVSRSMRDKGLEYKINWGIELPALRRMAGEYGKDYDLAIALWKENIRECKILATMIMPPGRMERDLLALWMEQTASVEIAELAAFNLYQYVPDVADSAFEWIASDSDIRQISGFHVFARLFMKGCSLNGRDACELIDQAQAVLAGGSPAARRAAFACLQRMAEVDDDMKKTVSETLNFVWL